MSKVFERIGLLSVRFRYLVVAAWIAGLIAAMAFLPSISSVVQNNFSNFLPKNSPSLQAANLAGVFQKANDSIVIVVIDNPHGTLSAVDQAYINNIGKVVHNVPKLISARLTAEAPSGQAAQIEILSGVSQFNDAGIKKLVDAVNSDIASVAKPANLQVHVAGTVATAVAQAEQNGTSANATQLYSVLFIFVLLLLVFRSVLAPFLTLIPAFLVSTLAGPIVARLTTVLHYQVSNITQLLMIVLVLGAGTDYGLFLVFRTREELRKGRSAKEAVELALARVGESITFSAFTVIAAVLSLVTATFGFYKSLGYPLAIAVLLMLLAGLTLQPALLAIFGRAAFWPSKARKVENARHGLWGRVAGKLVTRPVATLLVGVIFFGALALFAPQNQPSGFASNTSAPKGTSAYYGNQALSKYFPHATYNPTELIFKFREPIWNQAKLLPLMQSRIENSPLFTQVNDALNPAGFSVPLPELLRLHAILGPANHLPRLDPIPARIPQGVYALYRATGNYISPNGKIVLFAVTLKAGDPGLNPAINAVPQIRSFTANLARQVGAVNSGVAGEAPAAHDVAAASDHDLVHIVPVVIVIIAILLALVLRSLVAPIFLVISVALSYFAALGLAVILFDKIGSDQGLIFILPFMLFLFLLALGEDYNILVMTRIREEAHGKSIKDAVVEAIGATGSTVTSAGMVLAGTFLVLGLASGGQTEVEQIGVALALGVLMDTFLVRTLLVPSLVVLLGRVTWWPSKLSRDSLEAQPAIETASEDRPKEPLG